MLQPKMALRFAFIAQLLTFYFALEVHQGKSVGPLGCGSCEAPQKTVASERPSMFYCLSKHKATTPILCECSHSNEHSKLLSSFEMRNSSVELAHLTMRAAAPEGIATLLQDSILRVCSSIIEPSAIAAQSLFCSAGGEFLLWNMSLSLSPVANHIPTFVASAHAREASDIQSFIFASQCSFSSFTFSPTAPLLGSCMMRSVFLDVCSFCNVTSNTEPASTSYSTAVQTMMQSCVFEEVSAPFDGGITNGLHSLSRFAAQNCSFSHYYPASYTHTYTDPQNFTTNETILFEDCLFTVSGNYALYVKDATNVTITECSYTNCLCGAICFFSVKHSMISCTDFLNNSYSSCGGSIGIDLSNNATVEKCIFENSTAGRDGGAAHVNRGSQLKLFSCILQNCSDSATINYYGGGALWFGDAGSNLITDCSFSSCSSNQKGGAILFSNDNGNLTILPSFIKYCYFENNSAENGGHDICILDKWVQIITNESFVECRTMTARAWRIVNDSSDVSGWMVSGFFEEIKVNGEEGIDHKACGLNERKCKTISFTKSVVDLSKSTPIAIWVDPSTYVEGSYSVDSARIEFGNTGGGTVTVASSISSGSLFSVSTGSLKVASFDFLHDTTRSSKACSLFRLTSTGTLVLEGCSICVDGTNTAEHALEESLIVLEGGSTRIERTRMGPLWLSSKAAIRFSSECMVSVVNTSVCGAGRQSGSGGGIEGVVGTGKRVEIEGGEVSGCSSRSGNGGGVAVRMQGGSSLRMVRTRDEGSGSSFAGCTSQAGGGSGGLGGGVYLEAEERAVPDVEIRGAVFSGCVGVHGSNIFVRGDDLSGIVRKDLIELEDGAVEAGLAEGYEGSTTNEGFVIPLVSYLRTFTPPGHVAGAGGHNFTGCGHPSTPCSTIEYVLALRFGSGAGEVCLAGSFVIDHVLAIDEQPIAFSAEQAGMQVRISEDIGGAGESIICSSKDCSFCGMCFVVPQRMNVHIESVLRCNDMELVLSECGFGTEGGTLGMALAVVVKGCLKMQKLELNGLTFSTRAAFEIRGSGSSCICEELNWTDITMEWTNSVVKVSEGASLEISNSVVDGTSEEASSVIEVLGGATLSVRSTTLARIERQKGSGGAVLGRAGGGKATSVQNTTFEGCVCREAGRMEGGGVWMEVENSGTLAFGNNTVKGCSVDESGGAGGGMYLRLGESGVEYSMKQVVFGGNKAEVGRDVYLVCKNPRDMITSQRWEGSARKEEEEENKWVVDREVEPGINVSVLHYLFPPKINIVYVKSGGSSDLMCGDDVEPCGDLMFGFGKMRTDQTTVHIVDSCTLNALLDRNGQSVTIRGESSAGGSLFEVGRNGGFVLVMRDSSVSLMLEHLQFGLPGVSSVGQMIRIEGGKLFVDECAFGGSWAGRSATDMWIVKGSEGAVQMTKTRMLDLSFSGEGDCVDEGRELGG